MLSTPLDYDALENAGAILGSSVIEVLPAQTCMVRWAMERSDYLAAESCGKCVPCRVGVKRIAGTLEGVISCAGIEGRSGAARRVLALCARWIAVRLRRQRRPSGRHGDEILRRRLQRASGGTLPNRRLLAGARASLRHETRALDIWQADLRGILWRSRYARRQRPTPATSRFERNEHGQRSFDITVDGRPMRAYEGQTVLSVAIDNGILDIPNLCNDDKLEPTSACRMCLVEIDGAERPLPSCNTPATPGMVVRTKSDRLTHIRRTNLEMMLSDHNAYCQPPCQVGLPDAHRHPRLSGADREGAEPRGGAAGQRGAAVPLYPRPDVSRALPGGLPPRAGGRRDRHLPHARLCREQCLDDPPSPWPQEAATGKRVAVVGAGPSGLTAAYYLALKGHYCQGLRHAAPGGRHAALRHPGVSAAQGHHGSGVRRRLEAGRRGAVQRQARRRLHD